MRAIQFSSPGVMSAPGGDLSKTGCCCTPDCCMYPASGFGDTYTEEDLPDTIIFNNEYFSDVTLSKITANELRPGLTAYYQGGGLYCALEFDISDWGWTVVRDDDYTVVESFLLPCLISGDGNYTPGNDTVEDQFAATYTLTSTIGGVFAIPGSCECGTFGFNGPSSWTLTRTSLCYWQSEPFDVLCFNSDAPDGDPCKDGFPVTTSWLLYFDGTSSDTTLTCGVPFLVDAGTVLDSPDGLSFFSGGFVVGP